MNRHARLALLPILIIPLVCCSTLNRPCVRIGATQAEIHQGIENGKAGLNLHPREDQDPNFRVSAGFEKGVCNRIKYASVDKGKISEHAVSVILSLNSRRVAWIVQEFPKTEGKVYYRTVDGRYRAVLTNGTELLIFTEVLFRKTMSENDAKNQKSKAVTASLARSGGITQSFFRAYPKIRRGKYLALENPTPSLPEQTAILEVLSDMDDEFEALKTKLAKARQVKQGMMQELLTGRIRLV